MACYAVKQGEEDKIFGGPARLNEEDVTFSVTKNRDTNEILINGMGETHIDVIAKSSRQSLAPKWRSRSGFI